MSGCRATTVSRLILETQSACLFKILVTMKLPASNDYQTQIFVMAKPVLLESVTRSLLLATLAMPMWKSIISEQNFGVMQLKVGI